MKSILGFVSIFFFSIIFPYYFSPHGTRYCTNTELKVASLSYKFFIKIQDKFYHLVSHIKVNLRYCIKSICGIIKPAA